MTTPPGKDGKVNPTTLVAAKEAGADVIYKVGGAQAIAALAYGTESPSRRLTRSWARATSMWRWQRKPSTAT